MSSIEIISDYSKANLHEVPERVVEMTNLKMLFLERNYLVKLPENFFDKLPNLMWLDLRNNNLEELPRSIAHHEHLEHLLLTNNNIQRLPNELGLVINLKALQIADNPILYPPKTIIQEGTKSIKKYLKEQYENECTKNAANPQEQKQIPDELRNSFVIQEERLIKIHDDISGPQSMKPSINTFNAQTISNKQIEQKTIDKALEYFQSKLYDPSVLNPSLHVTKLDTPAIKHGEPMKVVHKVNKSDSKISLMSYVTKPTIKNAFGRISYNMLREEWLKNLKILLNDQERILQQERNLKALSTWRDLVPTKRNTVNTSERIAEPPFATYPEYAKIPSRMELAQQLQSFLNDPSINPQTRVTQQVNIDKVINDLVEQLKEMEANCNNVYSPRNEMEQAGKQIQMIVDIHKKLLQLKSANQRM